MFSSCGFHMHMKTAVAQELEWSSSDRNIIDGSLCHQGMNVPCRLENKIYKCKSIYNLQADEVFSESALTGVSSQSFFCFLH